jgi:hypothetical protein
MLTVLISALLSKTYGPTLLLFVEMIDIQFIEQSFVRGLDGSWRGV